MTVEIIIRGATGAQTARELLNFVASFECRGNSPQPEDLPEGFVEGLSRLAGVASELAEAKIKANFDAEATKSPVNAVSDTPKQGEIEEKTTKDEPAKEESVATRRARKAAPKAAEPTPEVPATPIVEATKPVEFTAPEGFNDNVKNDQAAPKETQDAALSKVKEFEPKDGEEVTLNYCRALLLYMAAKKGMDANRKMLEKFGVKKIAELSVERLKEFATAMKEESGV